jgi:hypothetical protein
VVEVKYSLFQLFATGFVDTDGKFTAGVNNTGLKLPPMSFILVENLPPLLLTPEANLLPVLLIPVVHLDLQISLQIIKYGMLC